MLKRTYLFMGILVSILFISGCGSNLPIETTMSENVNDFSFTNQDNESVQLEDLAGQWWLADFVFTNCETVCLPMTSNMAKLQTDLKKQDAKIQLISFSVDPDNDTPEVLKEYGEEYDADFSSWHFLTGYDFKTIKKLSIKSFRAMLNKPEYGDDQVTHDNRFFLVSPDGEIVKSYDGVNSNNMDDILEDILLLKKDDLL